MLQKDLKWHYPSQVAEVADILAAEPNAVFHAGGTAILRIGSPSVSGMIDLSGLGLDYIKKESDGIHIGAMSSLNSVIKSKAGKACTFHMVQEAAEGAASTPMRNRITIGGSLADSAPWTDLLGTLFCVDAQVVFLADNKSEKTMSVREFVDSKENKKKQLIKEIIIPENEIVFAMRRLARVNFEFCGLKVAVAAEKSGKSLKNVKAFITGTKGIYTEQSAVAAEVEGKEVTEDVCKAASEKAAGEYGGDVNYSADYKKRVAKVFIYDCLSELAGE